MQLRRVLDAMQAMRDGNFRRRLPVSSDGLLGELAAAYNDIAERQQHLASELSRVRRVAGRDGKHTERLRPGVGEGGWATAIEAANGLVADLVRPTGALARVVTAVSHGDLSQRMDVNEDGRPLRGEPLRLARSVNGLVGQLSSIADEITRVTREVGTEGKLGGQARVRSADGSWRDLIDAVNTMSSRLTDQVRDIALVTTAVANGDLSRTVTVEVSGEMEQLKDTVDRMVDQLSSFAVEVTRVSREVGTEGRLGGQAVVPGVAGTWRDLTDSVNTMASNLTSQVRGISSVAQAVAQGDLSQQITVTARGEVAELAETLNSMTATLQTFADEVTRVAREVGTEGILGGQAAVPGVAGTWRDLTDSVNFMADNLTGQVRDIAQVTTAVARGDLSQKITVDVRGELAELKTTVNTMVDQLSAFAAQVTRVAREVGSDGILGGQADVPGVAGTWKDLTDSVNFMASNLTGQVRNIAQVTTAVARGDLSQKITVDVRGELAELKTTVNTMVDQLSSFADEVTRVAREVGSEGQLGGQAAVPGVSGTWRDLTDSVNFMAGTLTAQVRNIAEVTTAVARGDLTRTITVEARGEILELKTTVNTMVDQLSSFADEVTRVAREVGTEGRLGGQADVHDVSGTWKDLTENVNMMAANLTSQVRNIAEVTTAVASGDLTRKITVDARGEILELKSTVNTMVDQLSAFADEVTRVAREVGTDGILGGQARVPGVAGTWRDLTDSVNSMASNLTNQVRSIADVSTGVARGDLSQKISIEARGEVAALASTINAMVDTLRAFADEVTRVAREVGTEGILGGQAHVRGVAGTWKDLTDSVNSMANNLTTPGAQHRPGHHRGRPRRPHPEGVRRRPRRDPRAQDHGQPDGRPALVVRRRGHPRRPRGRHRGQARRPGPGRRRVRHLAAADRERQPARRHPHHPAARDRRGVHRGHAGRPQPADHRPGAGRGGRAQGQPQRDDRQAPRDDARQRGAGLAEDQPGPVHRAHAGRPRPARRHPAHRQRAHPAGGRAPGLVLPQRQRRSAATSRCAGSRPTATGPASRCRAGSRSARASSGRPRRTGRRSCSPTCRPTTSGSPRASARAARSAS